MKQREPQLDCGSPFRIKAEANAFTMSPKKWIETMLEAERIAMDPKVKAYSVDDAFKELEK